MYRDGDFYADGYVDVALGGDDCDDSDPGVNPSESEVCDAADIDEDCGGLSDDAEGSATGQTRDGVEIGFSRRL